MMRMTVALMLAVLAVPAAAEDFPLNKPYKAISISGYDVIKAAITLDVAKDAKGEEFKKSKCWIENEKYEVMVKG